jgi:hypothetical protein
VRTRSSTQARSHAQKFFVKLQRRNEKLEDYLQSYDLDLMRLRMINPDADYEDTDSLNQSNVSKKREKKGNLKQATSALNIIVTENPPTISPVKQKSVPLVVDKISQQRSDSSLRIQTKVENLPTASTPQSGQKRFFTE